MKKEPALLNRWEKGRVEILWASASIFALSSSFLTWFVKQRFFFLTFFHFVVTIGDEKSLLVVQVAKYFDRSPVNKLEIITSRRFSWRQKMYVFTNNNIYITFDPDIFLI